MAYTTVSQEAVCAVSINGSAVDPTRIVSAEWEEGYYDGIAKATVVVTGFPTGWDHGHVVTITAGATAATSVLRFSGRIGDEFQYDPDPPASVVSIPCEGHLGRAAQYTVPINAGTTDDPGYDMVNGGAGATDVAQITSVLTTCGLSSYLGTIGGLGRLLGTQTGASTKGVASHYRWQRGETGLSYIQKLDAICLGFRTYDSLGQIVRRQISARPHASVSSATFTQGTDIFGGAKGTHSIKEAANHVTVQGYNYGHGPIQYTVTAPHPAPTELPTGVVYVPLVFSSPMIEKTSSSDAGVGLSTQEVAIWKIQDTNHRKLTPRFSTHRDPALRAGDTISVEYPAMEMGQTFFIRHLRGRVDEAGWTLELDCIAPAAVGAGGASFPISLGPYGRLGAFT